MDNKTRPVDDHYPTPPECTRALLSVEKFSKNIWEPCAGHGEMAKVLLDYGYDVLASTLNISSNTTVHSGIDFLKENPNIDYLSHSDIVTNPPYKLAEEMVRRAMGFNPDKCAMLFNIKFITSRNRYKGLWRDYMPSRLHIFVDRPSFYPADWTGKRTSTTETFAWFVWDKKADKTLKPTFNLLDSKDFV